jgi:hypothetical protein
MRSKSNMAAGGAGSGLTAMRIGVAHADKPNASLRARKRCKEIEGIKPPGSSLFQKASSA